MSEAPSPVTPATGWTVETALSHVLALQAAADKRYEQRFDAQQKAVEVGLASQKTSVDAALAAADRAVFKAENASEKRFEGVNEFRNQLGDQQRTFIPRSEVDLISASLTGKVTELTTRLNELQAERMGIKGGWGYAVGAVGFMMGLAGILFAVFGK